MLLLYLRACSGVITCTFIYIPFYFYFIEYGEEAPESITQIYIPLCFIYIPLCFYFIQERLWQCSHISYLHSTMLLLYHILNTIFFYCFFIYIPLCFYFIWSGTPRSFLQGTFTFHYASTLSANGSCYSQASYKFTFHFASTLSFCKLLAVFGNKHLHSTLLLLYQRSSGSSVYRREHAFTFHFASTLSWRMAQAYAPSFQFTFRFASTLSEEITDVIITLYQDLHSTLLLLYPTTKAVEELSELIYIPLCFYFIKSMLIIKG